MAIALGIGGGAVLAGGFALWGLAASTQSDIDSAPTATVADLQHLASLEDDGRRYAAIGNGLVIGGGLTVAAALGWILWSRSHEAGPVRVAPAVGPAGASVHLEASW